MGARSHRRGEHGGQVRPCQGKAAARPEEGTIDPEDRDLFWFAETAEEIWDDIQRWYDRAGRKFGE